MASAADSGMDIDDGNSRADSKELYKGVDQNDTEELEEDARSVLMQVLSQIKIGMDMTRVLIPVNFLEPRSLLEKITDFATHCDLFTNSMDPEDPVARMVNIVKWYLSGWHVKPKGVKKPYNPALGEIFRCNIELDDGSRMTYFAEQVSHHPPVSAIYGENKQKGIKLEGWYYPRSKLAGMNSAASVAEGVVKIYCTRRDEVYVATWPNVYARGIIYGKLVMEYGGKTHITCDKTGLVADIEFKTKPFFGGEYNHVAAKIRRASGGAVLHTISGKWNEAYFIKSASSSSSSKNHHHHSKDDSHGSSSLLFDTRVARRFEKNIQPIDKQLPNESQRLWRHLSDAIKRRDIEAASAEKTKVEIRQREKQAQRDSRKATAATATSSSSSSPEYRPRFFAKDPHGEEFWHFTGADAPEYTVLEYKMNRDTGDFEIPETERAKYEPMLKFMHEGNADWAA